MTERQTREHHVDIAVTGTSDCAMGTVCDVLTKHRVAHVRKRVQDLSKLPTYDAIAVVTAKRAPHALRIVDELRSEGCSLYTMIVAQSEFNLHLSVHAFSVGADDCIAVPFDEHELVARIGALRARATPPPVDPLTPAERTIFNYLASHRDTWSTSQQIIRDAFGTNHTQDTALIRVHIHHMRRKLKRFGIEIRSERGFGYTLNDRNTKVNPPLKT